MDKIVLDVIGKEVVEGLDEPDSIQAQDQLATEDELEVLETPKTSKNLLK